MLLTKTCNFICFQAHLAEDECDAMRIKTIELARACLDVDDVHPLKYNLFTSNCELFATLLIALTLHYYARDNHTSAKISDTVASIYDTVAGPDKGTGRSHGLEARIQVSPAAINYVFNVFGVADGQKYRALRNELVKRINAHRSAMAAGIHTNT